MYGCVLLCPTCRNRASCRFLPGGYSAMMAGSSAKSSPISCMARVEMAALMQPQRARQCRATEVVSMKPP